MRAEDSRNCLLAKLTPKDAAALLPLLQFVDLPVKAVVLEAHRPIEWVYFPETMVCAILALTEKTPPIEVGLVGFEGMSDMVLRAGDLSPTRTIVQLPGTAWRMPAADFAASLRSHASLLEITLRFKEVLATQFAYTAFAHGNFNITERLARWILMAHDRVAGDTLPVVHELLAMMLSVRRSGVTTAMHVIEGTGAIKATRASIQVRDRTKLLDLAGDSYGVTEAEYARLLPE